MHFMRPYCPSIIHDLRWDFPNNNTDEELLVPEIPWIHTCDPFFDLSHKPGTMIFLSAFLYTLYICDTFEKHNHKHSF